MNGYYRVKDHGIPVLNWPVNSPDPIESPIPDRKSMVYCEEEDSVCQTQQCRAEGYYQSNLGSHNTWVVPQTDGLHATLHCSSNSGKRTRSWVLSAVYCCSLFMFMSGSCTHILFYCVAVPVSSLISLASVLLPVFVTHTCLESVIAHLCI